MRAWKGVVFMWSVVMLIMLVDLVTSYPRETRDFIAHNPQIVGTIVTTPVMIWLIWWMMRMLGGNGKKPQDWWKDDDRSNF